MILVFFTSYSFLTRSLLTLFLGIVDQSHVLRMIPVAQTDRSSDGRRKGESQFIVSKFPYSIEIEQPLMQSWVVRSD